MHGLRRPPRRHSGNGDGDRAAPGRQPMSDDDDLPSIEANQALRQTVRTVAALNLSYFGIEFAVALAIGSVALFADSVDFLEDGAVNLLILAGLGFSATRR